MPPPNRPRRRTAGHTRDKTQLPQQRLHHTWSRTLDLLKTSKASVGEPHWSGIVLNSIATGQSFTPALHQRDKVATNALISATNSGKKWKASEAFVSGARFFSPNTNRRSRIRCGESYFAG